VLGAQQATSDILEQETHNDLLEREGLYAQQYQTQFRHQAEGPELGDEEDRPR
jgi:hypothetical protein